MPATKPSVTTSPVTIRITVFINSPDVTPFPFVFRFDCELNLFASCRCRPVAVIQLVWRKIISLVGWVVDHYLKHSFPSLPSKSALPPITPLFRNSHIFKTQLSVSLLRLLYSHFQSLCQKRFPSFNTLSWSWGCLSLPSPDGTSSTKHTLLGSGKRRHKLIVFEIRQREDGGSPQTPNAEALRPSVKLFLASSVRLSVSFSSASSFDVLPGHLSALRWLYWRRKKKEKRTTAGLRCKPFSMSITIVFRLFSLRFSFASPTKAVRNSSLLSSSSLSVCLVFFPFNPAEKHSLHPCNWRYCVAYPELSGS